MILDIFTSCHRINDLINSGSENNAREELIKLLDYHEREGISYSPLLNSLIRQVGLYPYLQTETSGWQDQFVYESFKTNVGPDTKLTLHREQSSVLKKLLEGQNLAVSAPTSFGKSFIIDAFISIKRPKNVVIIVPTIALTDETRRRLQKKFSHDYKIITTSDVEVAENNIFIFPQERSINYLEKLDEIDILVVDEFYKASQKFDKERASSLTKAIIKLSTKARQKYFLAPNITSLNENILTKDMVFLPIDFNTVFLEMNELYKEIKKDENLKSEALINILNSTKGKTLIYAGTYPNINKVATLLIGNESPIAGDKLTSFEKWLTINYEKNWNLTSLVRRGCGIHNGQMHRSLSQIQIRLFEEEDGLKNIISTSSIIEGVNTSAENVVIWANKNGQSRLNDFTYKNIIGRGGRMFKHFIGKIYILEEPPASEEVELNLNLPDNILSSIDSEEIRQDLTPEQISKIIAYENEMSDLLGDETFTMMKGNSIFDSSDGYLIRDIARDISSNKDEWNGLGFLNSDSPDDWDRFLYKAINFHPGGWGIEYWKFVEFIKVISNNWDKSIPELLEELEQYDIGIDDFFKLERNITFKLSATFNDINILQKKMLEKPTDISPFISKLSHAFLPPLVYQLEEYGLPRMITKKIHQAKIINFEHPEVELHIVLNIFKTIPLDILIDLVPDLDTFDKYILSYFYDGI